jgi:hypothetical protein
LHTPPAPCFTCLSIEAFIANKSKNIAHICLLKKKSRKPKNDSNRRGEYRKFYEIISQMRESVIKLYVEKVIAHATVNARICHQGFIKELVNKAAQVAPLLIIIHNDIKNKVRNIIGQCKQWEVSLVIPYHAIGCLTLSTNPDSNISSGLISKRTSAENPLDILASQAAVMLEPTNQCAVSMQITLPNRCSYERCGAPLNLVPKHCFSCLRLVNQLCQKNGWSGH